MFSQSESKIQVLKNSTNNSDFKMPGTKIDKKLIPNDMWSKVMNSVYV